MPRNYEPRKVHLDNNGAAACGSVVVSQVWPHTVGSVIWSSVVPEYKCRVCQRIFQRDNTSKRTG